MTHDPTEAAFALASLSQDGHAAADLLHDAALAEEIDLLGELVAVATAFPRRLHPWEIDQVLGLAPPARPLARPDSPTSRRIMAAAWNTKLVLTSGLWITLVTSLSVLLWLVLAPQSPLDGTLAEAA